MACNRLHSVETCNEMWEGACTAISYTHIHIRFTVAVACFSLIDPYFARRLHSCVSTFSFPLPKVTNHLRTFHFWFRPN